MPVDVLPLRQKRSHGKGVPLVGICDKSNHFCIKFTTQSCKFYYWIPANIVTIKIWPCLQRYTYIHMMLILFKIFGGWGIAGRKAKSNRQVLRSAEAETHLGGDGGGSMGSSGKKPLFFAFTCQPCCT